MSYNGPVFIFTTVLSTEVVLHHKSFRHLYPSWCTHRGHDGWFEDSQWYFGTFSIISETLDFHHVELVFSFSSHTHLQKKTKQKQHSSVFATLPPQLNASVIYLICLSWYASCSESLNALNEQSSFQHFTVWVGSCFRWLKVCTCFHERIYNSRLQGWYYTSLLQNRTHMQNRKGRKQSTVHFGAQIKKHQQA